MCDQQSSLRWRFLVSGTSVGLGLLLAGCTALDKAPEPDKLAMPLLSDNFLNSAKPAKAVVATPATAPEFWNAFGSPDLVRLVDRAERGSRDIDISIARVKQAEANTQEAVTGFLPTGGLGATSTTYRSSATSAGLPEGKLPVGHLRKAGLNASWELDFWGKNAAIHEAARRKGEASIFALAATRLTITSETALSYVQVLSLRDQLALARQNLSLARKVRDNVAERVEAGSATEVTLAQQETVVLQQEASIVRLSRAQMQEEINLALLVGARPGEITLDKGGLSRLTLPNVDAGLPSDLLSRRPDVREVEEQLLASASNVGAARAAMLPSLTISLQKGFESLSNATLFSPQSGVFTLTSQLTQPLFDAPRLAAQLQASKAQRDELVATYEKAVLTALTDVEKALVALNAITREASIAAKATASARKAYDLTLEQLEAGQVDMTTVLNTQRDYFSAADSLAQIRLARFQAAIGLYRAMGGGWSPEDARALMAQRQPSQAPGATAAPAVLH